jgi:acetyl-CoA synthetase
MAGNIIDAQDIAWHPDDAAINRSCLKAFMQFCGLDSYDTLYQRSIDDVAWFTGQVLSFMQIQFDRPYEQVLDLSRGFPWARWCIGGKLNITRTCLDQHLDTPRSSVSAVIWEGEERVSRTLTYAELFAAVARCAAGLRAVGVARGDTVGLCLPMMPETVVALLAIARIGAVAVPLFSGYGPAAIEARLRDVGAKALFACDAFPRRGVAVPAQDAAAEAVERRREVARVIYVSRMGIKFPMRSNRDMAWSDLLQLGNASEHSAGQAELTEAEDPLMVLYSSGTTGRPKGIVHSHCGFPVKAAQDMAFGTDVGPGDRIAWITDIGWMMGPWLVYGATALGATIVLYDGAPDYPDPDRLWDFCARHQVGILGISPTLIRAMSSRNGAPRLKHDLSHLRILASTGEPWNPDPWRWLFEQVGGKKLPIINYSGGTEISGGILMGNPLAPIKPCSFSGPCPGIAADVIDENGHPLRDGVGELVIRKPWIGMARGFWNDPERYLQTYWSYRPEVWRHGDWARIDPDGHWQILGRSDDTIKVAGKRIGPAEIESILVSHPCVGEAAVVGVPDKLKGSVAIAFCVPSAPGEPGPELCYELRQLVAKELGKPLCPEKVFLVPDLPRTRNAKIMRRVIRSAYLNEDPGNISALENPGAIEAIQQIAQANAHGMGEET